MNHEWTCDRIDEYLDSYLDDTLAPGDRQAVERHLTGCPECAAAAAKTRRLLGAARALPREMAPARDLWPEIAARIGAGARVESHVTAPALWAGLLAAVLAVLVVVTGLLAPAGDPARTAGGRGADVPAGDGVQPVLAAAAIVTAIEAETQQPARAAARVARAGADPAVGIWLADLERGRAVVDEAVAQLRTAYLMNPDDPALAQQLARTASLRARLDARATEMLFSL